MRDVLWAVINLTAAIIVAAAAVLFADQLGAWRILLWIGVAGFFAASLGLVIHSICQRKIKQEPNVFPNWRIKDLFSYLRSDVLEVHEGVGIWERLGDEVIDKASLGQLKVWGRIFDVPGGPRYTLGRRAIQPIEATYWQQARFSFAFFYADTEAAHTFAGYANSTVVYTDLQVNETQARAIWPDPLDF